MKHKLKRKLFTINLTITLRFRLYVDNLIFNRQKIKKKFILIFCFFFDFFLFFIFYFFSFIFTLKSKLKTSLSFLKNSNNVKRARWKRRKRINKKSKTRLFSFFISSNMLKLRTKSINKQISRRLSQNVRLLLILRITISRRKKIKKQSKKIKTRRKKFFWRKFVLIIEWKFIYEFFKKNQI